VLLQGESGTGKELIAKALHLNSPRRDRTFVPVNTGSMPADLLESTLFGHVKGAFTSAIASKKGLFEVADRGTLFLDEIGTMGVDTQSKILRVLQDRKFMHLGGVHEIQADVRIIAATNVDLRQLVREGKFREDLFYRLNVITIDLPPLRQRKEDIPCWWVFLRVLAGKRPSLRRIAEALRPWSATRGRAACANSNAIERAVVSPPPQIGPDLLPDTVVGRARYSCDRERGDASLFDVMEQCERHIILDMLEKCGWNQTGTAERFHLLFDAEPEDQAPSIEIKKKIRNNFLRAAGSGGVDHPSAAMLNAVS
jgi:transcriptional regulator with PAS, ATPase and Fis domain